MLISLDEPPKSVQFSLLIINLLCPFPGNSNPNSSAPSPSANSSSAPTGPDGMHDETSQQSTLSQSSDRSDGGGGRQTPKQTSNAGAAANSGPPGQPGPGQYPPPPGQYPPGSPHSSAPSPGGSENSYGGPPGGPGGWGAQQQQGRPMTSPAPQVRPTLSFCHVVTCVGVSQVFSPTLCVVFFEWLWHISDIAIQSASSPQS